MFSSKIIIPAFFEKLNFARAAACFFVILCLAYFNALNNPFMIDDFPVILNNPLRGNWRGLPLQFVPEFQKDLNFDDALTAPYYRPLAHILPLVQYAWFGENPAAYHITNLLLFWLAVLTVFSMTTRLTGDTATGFLTGLFVAAHPFFNIIVNYKTAVVFAVQLVFMCSSFLFFLKSLDRPKIRFLVLSTVLFIFSVLCHEVSLILPGFFLLYLAVNGRKFFREHAVKLLPAAAVISAFVVVRATHASLNLVQSNTAAAITGMPVAYFVNLTRIFGVYLQQLLLPVNIILKYGMPPHPGHPGIVLAIGAGLAACGVSLAFSKKVPVVRKFCWLGFFAGFLPVGAGTLIEGGVFYIFEPHWVYFPAIFWFILVASCLSGCLRRFPGITATGLSAMLVFLIVVSIRLNCNWHSEESYAKYWQSRNPEYHRPALILLNYYVGEQRAAEARVSLVRASANCRRNPKIYETVCRKEILNSWAFLEHQIGNLKGARVIALKALEFNPGSSVLHLNYGIYSREDGDLDAALEHFRRAVDLNPRSTTARFQLARLYFDAKNYREAVRLCRHNLDLDPVHKETVKLLFQAYLGLEERGALMVQSRRLLDSIHDARQLGEWAVFFTEKLEHEIALDFFEKGFRIDPANADNLVNGGIFFVKMNKFDEARKIWEYGLSKHPENPGFLENLKNLDQLSTTKSPFHDR
jgi:tetratricopeptide (TPR) repeat protein